MQVNMIMKINDDISISIIIMITSLKFDVLFICIYIYIYIYIIYLTWRCTSSSSRAGPGCAATPRVLRRGRWRSRRRWLGPQKHVCVYIYIYIYTYVQRERERFICNLHYNIMITYTSLYSCVIIPLQKYIYIYIILSILHCHYIVTFGTTQTHTLPHHAPFNKI